MPAYDSLSTQIDAMKTKINSMVASATTSQDIIYLAKALGELGGLLGVDDIVAATAAKIAELESTKNTGVAALETKRVNSLADINADAAASLQSINTATTSGLNQITGASTTLHPFLMAGV